MLRVKHLLKDKADGSSIWTVDADKPVLEAIRMMAERHIGALPVMRDNALVGIVSERDYARKIILQSRASAQTPVWEIMTATVITVSLEDSVHHCMQLMTDKRVRHLPVMDKGKLIAMVSIGDVLKAVLEEQQQTITQLERYIAS